MNILDVREIDDETVVTHTQSAGVVSATSNRNLNTVLPPEMNRCYHIGYVCAPGDQSRLAADHGVIHFACIFIAFIRRFDQCTPELSSQFNDGLLIHEILRMFRAARIRLLFRNRWRDEPCLATNGCLLRAQAWRVDSLGARATLADRNEAKLRPCLVHDIERCLRCTAETAEPGRSDDVANARLACLGT